MNAHIADEELERIISDLRRRIRESGAQSPPGPDPPAGAAEVAIDRLKLHYTLNEIAGVPDESFLTHAYQSLLKREPDTQGLDHHARLLHEGLLNKADIAIDIANSPEARRIGTTLVVSWATRLRRLVCNLPLIGRFARILVHLVQLNSLVAEQQRHHFHGLALRRSLADVEASVRGQDWSVKQINATIGHLDVNKAAFADLQELRSKIEDVSVSAVLSTGRVESSVSATLSELRQALEHVRSVKAEIAAVQHLEARAESVNATLNDLRQVVEESEMATKAAVAAAQAETARLRGDLEEATASLMNRGATNTLLLVNEAVEAMRGDISAMSGKVTATELALAGMEAQVDSLRARSVSSVQLEEMNAGVHDLSQMVAGYRTRVTDIERRLNLVLGELRKRLPEPISEEQLRAAAEFLASMSDRSYVDFEDLYRGTREDIKRRQAIYLPDIRNVLADAHSDMTVLDLGCGRGEWLELLRDNDIAGVGVDSNTVMVEQSRELGLDARQGDAIHFVAGLKANSVSVITGFHIIEHLPLDRQLRLMDESLRVLTPGGMIILETPNPANLRVGGCSFYLDPTHIKPLPAEQLSFLIESRGFVRTRILNLHPAQPPEYLPPSPEGRIIKDLLFGPQDYAVLAFKA